MMLFALLLAALPNTTPIPGCVEPTCKITAVSSATAQLQIGATAGAWCATSFTPVLPLTVSYPANTYMCPAGDPDTGVVKSLVAVQQSSSYTITYSIGGTVQPVLTVPALPPVMKNLTCAGTIQLAYNETTGSFTLAGSNLSCH